MRKKMVASTPQQKYYATKNLWKIFFLMYSQTLFTTY